MRLGRDGVTQLVADYEAGASVPELQHRYGSSKSAVVSILKEHGVKMRRQPLDGQVLAQVIELYESGLSIRQVAARVGVPKTTVQNALAKTEVAMRPAVRVKRSGAPADR